MKTILTFSLAILTIAASSNQWTQKANVGGAGRADAAGCAIGGKGYIGTGYITGYTKDWWEYDTLTNVWTQKADFTGSPTVESICTAINGKAYLIPFNTTDFYCYDPATNTWSLLAAFPGSPRQGAIAFSMDGKGYFGLGASGNLSTTMDDLWQYDPNGNNWTQMASLPAASRMHAAAFAVGAKGYVGTGYNAPGGNLSDFWEYDAVLNSWTQRSSFPGGPRNEGTAFSIGSYGYMGGGYGTTPQSAFWRYNPANDTWTPIASLPPGGRVETVCFTIGNSGYLGTGWDGVNFKNDFWKYSPDSVLSGFDLAQWNAEAAIHVYPNPVSNSLYVEHTFHKAAIFVFDAAGRTVIQQNLSDDVPVNTSSLPEGWYTFQLLHEKGRAGGKFLKADKRE